MCLGFVFSLVGGTLADNYPKNYVLIIGNLFAAAITLFLIFVVTNKQLNFAPLYFGIFALGSVDPLIHPSFQSIIPEIVDYHYFVNANATIQTIDNTLSIIGPLVGGTFVTLIGSIHALWLDGFSFFLAALVLNQLPHLPKKQCQHQRSHFLSDIIAGARYSFHEKVIFSGSIMFLVTNFALNLFEANFIYYMTRTLHYPIIRATFAMALGGVGSLLAGLVGSKVINHFKAGWLLSTATIMAGLSTLLLLLNTSYLYIGFILGLISFFGTINVMTYFTLRQKSVPSPILGRVIAVTRMVSYASIPVGSWVGGFLLAQGVSMTMVILLAGLIRALAGIGAKLSPLEKEK